MFFLGPCGTNRGFLYTGAASFVYGLSTSTQRGLVPSTLPFSLIAPLFSCPRVNSTLMLFRFEILFLSAAPYLLTAAPLLPTCITSGLSARRAEA
jgi:hypothetical protein